MSSVLPSPTGAGVLRSNRVTLGVLAVGYLLMVVPTVRDLARLIWQSDEQGHGPIIVAVSLWLMWRRREEIATASYQPANVIGGLLLALSLLLYVLGRSQQIIQAEVVGMITTGISLLLLLRGMKALRLVAFPFFSSITVSHGARRIVLEPCF